MRRLSAALAPWRKPFARHDPGKILLDPALSLAVGGDCLADIAQLRAHPQVFGPVASDPTVSRLIDTELPYSQVCTIHNDTVDPMTVSTRGLLLRSFDRAAVDARLVLRSSIRG